MPPSLPSQPQAPRQLGWGVKRVTHRVTQEPPPPPQAGASSPAALDATSHDRWPIFPASRQGNASPRNASQGVSWVETKSQRPPGLPLPMWGTASATCSR